MKFGVRKPSVNKSISARTTGRLERASKRAINPSYGRKGAGFIKDPARSSYNKVYNKTSYSVYGKRSSRRSSRSNEIDGATGCITWVVIIIVMISCWFAPFGTLIAVCIGGPILMLIAVIFAIIYILFYIIRELISVIIPKR
ncbi:MAG: hypothetical protein E7C49_12495 [Clostridium sp.]|nr:hypothetical protein [Clostridium sp.]